MKLGLLGNLPPAKNGAILKDRETIRFNGKDLPVLGRHRIRGEQYLVVDKLGRPPRQSEKVLRVQRRQRPEEKVIHRLVDNPESWELIERVKRFQGTRMPFPKIDKLCQKSGEILVARDFIEGRSLRWHLRMKKEISAFQAIRLYQQLVCQICFLHRKVGIVHGDLSPENIIVSPAGTSVSLIDFGSSFSFSESANPDAGDGFREIYQAPENLLGKAPSRRSEQFSAASIFYEMLTGKTPFNLAAKREFKTRPSKLLPASEQPDSDKRLPQALWHLIDKHLSRTLALESSQRFQTLGDWQNSAEDLLTKAKHPELLELELRNQSVWRRINSWFKR